MSLLAILVIVVGALEILTFATVAALYFRARSVFRATFPALVRPRKAMGEPPPAPSPPVAGAALSGPRTRPRKRRRG